MESARLRWHFLLSCGELIPAVLSQKPCSLQCFSTGRNNRFARRVFERHQFDSMRSVVVGKQLGDESTEWERSHKIMEKYYVGDNHG